MCIRIFYSAISNALAPNNSVYYSHRNGFELFKENSCITLEIFKITRTLTPLGSTSSVLCYILSLNLFHQIMAGTFMLILLFFEGRMYSLRLKIIELLVFFFFSQQFSPFTPVIPCADWGACALVKSFFSVCMNSAKSVSLAVCMFDVFRFVSLQNTFCNFRH